MGKRLFVGNLAYDVTEEQLRTVFAEEGRQVGEVKIMTDRDTGQPRGFGFVELATDAEAKAAIAAVNGREVNGRALTVNEAKERTRGGDFGGGRGGFGGGGGRRGF